MKETSLSKIFEVNNASPAVIKDVRKTVIDIMKELESNLIQGNKLNYTKTISTIKRKMGDKLI